MSEPFQPVTLYAPDGSEYVAGTPVEATELRASGYRDTKPFDPAEHTAAEVQQHLEQNPAEAPAVVAAEQSGKGRKAIVGDQP